MGRHRALLAVAATAILAACEFAPATLEPLPTAGPSSAPAAAQGPSIAIDDAWRVEDGVWTFSARIDPRGSPTRVVMEVGHDSANWRSFVREVPVVEGMVDAGQVSGSVEVGEETWLCVRFRAANAGGDGVSRPHCLPTAQPRPSPSS